MPAVVPVIISAAATGAAAAGGGLLAATAFSVLGVAVTVGQVAAVALTIGGGVLSSQINKPKRPQAQAPNVTVRQGVPVLPDVYGRCRIGGHFALYHAGEGSDIAARDLHAVAILAAHEIDAVEAIYDGDTLLWTLEDGVVDDYTDRLQVFVRLGAPGQTPPAELLANLPVTLAGATGTNFKATGRAYVYLWFGLIRDRWGGRVPDALWFRVRGKKVYDPRTETTAWSDNLALIARDYVISRGGLSPSFVDDDAIEAAANLADEDVTLDGGGTQDRYRFNGAIASDADVRDFLPEMLRHGVGKPVWTGAKLQIQLGAYSAPVASYGPDDFLAPVELTGETLVEERWDRVEGVYADADANYQVTGYGALTLDDYDPEAGDPRVLTLDLSRETNHERAQRLALLTLRQSRRLRRVKTALLLTTETTALLPGQRVTLKLDAIGLDGVFEIVSRRSVYDPASPRVEIEGVEDGTGFWTWSADTATAPPPALGSNLPDPRVQAPPTGLTVTAGIRVEADGMIARWLDVSWTAPAEARYLDYYEVTWVQDGKTRTRRTTATFARLDDLNATDGVTVAVVAVNSLGVRSDAATLGAVTPGGDVTGPAVPPSGTITPVAGGFQFRIGNPADADLAALRLYEGASGAAFGATTAMTDHPATPAGQPTEFMRLGLAPETARSYYVTGVDRSGNEGPAFGPLTGTTPAELTPEAVDALIAGAAADAANALDIAGDAQDAAADAIAAATANEALIAAEIARLEASGLDNLIRTGTFEDGDLGGWTGDAAVVLTTGVSGAGDYTRMLRVGATDGDPAYEGPFYEEDVGGRTFRITALAKTAGETRALLAGLQYERLSGAFAGVTAELREAGGSGGLVASSCEVTVPHATLRWRPQLVPGGPGSGAADLDIVQIVMTDVTEVEDLRAYYNRAASVLAADGIAFAQEIVDAQADATAADARITTELSKSSAVLAGEFGGFAQELSALKATVETPTTGLSAKVTSLEQADVTLTAAIAQTESDLRAEFEDAAAALSASITANAVAIADAETSIATTATTLRAQIGGANLIHKGNFDDETTGLWTGSPTTSTQAPTAAARSMRMQTAGSSEDPFRLGDLNGRTLRYRGYVRTLAGDRSARARILYTRPDGTIGAVSAQVAAAGAGWTAFSVDLTVSEPTRDWKPALEAGSETANAVDIFWANLELEEATGIAALEASTEITQTAVADLEDGLSALIGLRAKAGEAEGVIEVFAFDTGTALGSAIILEADEVRVRGTAIFEGEIVTDRLAANAVSRPYSGTRTGNGTLATVTMNRAGFISARAYAYRSVPGGQSADLTLSIDSAVARTVEVTSPAGVTQVHLLVAAAAVAVPAGEIVVSVSRSDTLAGTPQYLYEMIGVYA